MDGSAHSKPSLRLHKMAGGLSGAVGGAFGLSRAGPSSCPFPPASCCAPLPLSPAARGRIWQRWKTAWPAWRFFALGGRGSADDAADTGYYAVRASLAKTLSEAAQYIARKGLTDKGAPVLVRLMTQIASRLGVLVSEKAAVQAVPVIGAAGGGGHQSAVHRSFPGHRPGAFHRAPSGTGRMGKKRCSRLTMNCAG